MATISNLDITINTNSGTKTVTATPTVNDLIIIITAHTGNTSDALPTDDNADGLGTYTAVQTNVKNGSADKTKMFVRGAFIGSATSTIFTHAPGATSGGFIQAIAAAGMPDDRVGATAKRQSGGQDNQSADTPAPAFPGAALTANPIITTVFSATNPSGLTLPGSYTQLGGDSGWAAPVTGSRRGSRDSGETNTTITWGSVSASDFCSSVLELDTSEVSGTTIAWIRA